MASASLVRDKTSNLNAAAFRKIGQSMEYELAFPYNNKNLGDSLWQLGKAYQLAIVVGPSETFNGLTPDSWMSDQIYVRLGSPSQESIYHPPLMPLAKDAGHQQDHPKGAH